MNIIKPCPFCGREVKMYTMEQYGYISCENCGCAMRNEDPCELIKTWNKRASDWIPTSECMPQPHRLLLATLNPKGCFRPEVCRGGLLENGQWNIFETQRLYETEHITAWMPYPEPYEGKM